MTPREPLTQEYVHQPLNQEIKSISGHYVLVKEVRLSLDKLGMKPFDKLGMKPFDKLGMKPFEGREVLYLVGHAAFDACCGVGGGVYGLVPGFVLRWKYKTDSHGLPVSLVEPIRDQDVQRALARLIKKQELAQQVVFN